MPRQLRSADRLGLRNFQIAHFDQQIADFGEIGRIIVSLLHAPLVVFFDQVQITRALDVNGGDIVDLEIRQKFLAEFVPGGVPGFLIAMAQHQASPAKNNQGRQKKDQLFAIHFAAVRLRFTKAKTIPVTATRAGMTPMLATFVQNSSASVSLASFLRTDFSSLLASATVF